MLRPLVASSVLCLYSAAVAQSRPAALVPMATVPVGPMAGRPVLVDLDGDGALDIVLACGTCCGSQPDPASGHVMVLRGNGRGGFAPMPGYPLRIGSSARKLAVGEVDGDGAPDVVVAQHESHDLVVLRNDGQGRLLPAGTLTLGQGARPHTHEVALADLDGDGDLDLLATLVNDNLVAVARNDGKGSFTALAPLRAGRHPYDALAVADLDGDRKADLVVPNLVVHTVTALRGGGDGSFAVAGTPQLLAPRPGYLVAGDVDRDGRVDVLVSHDDDALVSVLLGDGRGGFRRGAPIALAHPVWGSVLVDLDGDGVLDLAAAAGDQGVVALRNDGAGRFAPLPGSPFAAGRLASYVAAGDVDGDGRVDLVAANYGSGDVTVLRNQMVRPGAASSSGAGAAPDLEQVCRVLGDARASAADRRQAWCQALSGGWHDAALARLGAGHSVALASAYLELFDVAAGSPAMKDWAERAEAACDMALAQDAGNREARWLKARALALWPKSAGKTDAAVAQLDTLLQQCDAAQAPADEVARARRLREDLRRR